MKAAASITVEAVRAALAYDPLTGVITWRVNRAPRVKAGDVAGTLTAYGYLAFRFRGVTRMAHRWAWFHHYGMWPANEIDHINGDRSDNRIANLRDVPKAVNLQNQRIAHSNSSHGYLGVRVEARWGQPRFMARITLNGVRRSLGTFDTAAEAHAAYLKAKRAIHPGCTI